MNWVLHIHHIYGLCGYTCCFRKKKHMLLNSTVSAIDYVLLQLGVRSVHLPWIALAACYPLLPPPRCAVYFEILCHKLAKLRIDVAGYVNPSWTNKKIESIINNIAVNMIDQNRRDWWEAETVAFPCFRCCGYANWSLRQKVMEILTN
jgi:hypothetical protein